MYITPSSECNSNIDTHSSLFCISSQLLLKTKHFSLSIQQKLAKSVEVRLGPDWWCGCCGQRRRPGFWPGLFPIFTFYSMGWATIKVSGYVEVGQWVR